jgi:hypothetical protein
MTTKIFETNDRTTAHRHLELVLAAGEFPLAECRENHNEESPYQVWSGPEVREPAPPTPVPAAAPAGLNIRFSDEELAKIGQAMAAAMKGGS